MERDLDEYDSAKYMQRMLTNSVAFLARSTWLDTTVSFFFFKKKKGPTLTPLGPWCFRSLDN